MNSIKFNELQRYAKLWGVSMFHDDETIKDLGEILFELNLVWANLTEDERTTCETIINYLGD